MQPALETVSYRCNVTGFTITAETRFIILPLMILPVPLKTTQGRIMAVRMMLSLGLKLFRYNRLLRFRANS